VIGAKLTEGSNVIQDTAKVRSHAIQLVVVQLKTSKRCDFSDICPSDQRRLHVTSISAQDKPKQAFPLH
jgi:hypothetical protein